MTEQKKEQRHDPLIFCFSPGRRIGDLEADPYSQGVGSHKTSAVTATNFLPSLYVDSPVTLGLPW